MMCWYLLCILYWTFLFNGLSALRDVKLKIPSAVERGKQAKLICNYDMEGDLLYAVKWYKNYREFFRYTPLDSPPYKQFPTPYLEVIEKLSNGTCVILNNVSIGSSGEFSCEISADAPSFFTIAATGNLQVVEVPKEGPSIKGHKARYRINETLKVECLSSKSHPAVNLTWFVNDFPVKPVHLRRSKPHLSHDGFYSARLGLRQVITQELLVNGRLRIRCLASMHDIYTRSSEVSIELEKSKTRLKTTPIPVLELEQALPAERYPHTTLFFSPSTNNNNPTLNNDAHNKSMSIMGTLLIIIFYNMR